MVTPNEKLIPSIQALQESALRQSTGLAIWTTIAVKASQNEVPNSIQRKRGRSPQQHPRVKVVNISQKRGHALDRNVTEAIETLALLISVQRIAATGQVRSTTT
jgi:hypothetical protein